MGYFKLDDKASAYLILLTGLVLATAPVQAQELFPQPFLVEHQLVQSDPDGEVFAADSVVDYFGGSLIVTRRPDDSRGIIDFAARTITEISPDRGTFTVLTFDQLAELRWRLWLAEMRQVNPGRAEEVAEKRSRPAAEPSFRFEQLPVEAGLESSADGLDTVQKAGVGHVRVQLETGSNKTATQLESLAVDVWFDSGLRLTEAALDALARFESEVLAEIDDNDEVPPARYVMAARRQAQGAIPVRTRRPASAQAALAGDASMIEDVVIRFEPVPELPANLTEIPEGYRRALHPLEKMVAYAEEQAEFFQRAQPNQ